MPSSQLIAGTIKSQPGVPQEIIDLRKQSTDYHLSLGQPVIHKHRWNERDERNGLAQRCPFHDPYYDQDLASCQYCFGTGYLGGYDDGVLTYVALADAQEDTFRLTPQGLLLHDRSPTMTAPWQPEMGDGDMVITVELDPHSFDVQNTYDRYTLREVTPITVRGPGFKNTTRSRPYVVNQSSQVDVIPFGSTLQDVPITFDYAHVPMPVQPDPTKPPLPAGYSYAEYEVAVRIVGKEFGLRSFATRDVRVAVAGNNTQTTYGVRITGKAAGTHVYPS